MTKRYPNPTLQNEIEFTDTTNGTLRFKTYLQAGGGQTQSHYHTQFSEFFKVVDGVLHVDVNGTTHILYKNDTALIRPYDIHRFYNASNASVTFEVDARPALNLKKGLQIMYGLAKDHKVNATGIPTNIFHLAIGVHMLDAYSPSIPLKLQQLGISTLATVGKLLGIKKRLLTRYCT